MNIWGMVAGLAASALVLTGCGQKVETAAEVDTEPVSALTGEPYFDGPCANDLKTPDFWKELESHLASQGLCNSSFRLVQSAMPQELPASVVESQPSGQVKSCKIDNYKSARTRAFSSEKDLHLNPNTKLQVVPFFAKDTAPGISNPQEDYAGYFSYLKDFVDYISDGPSAFEIRVPDHYFELDAKVAKYGIEHQAGPEFLRDVIKIADSEIDFSDANYVIFFAPPETRLDVLGQAGGGGVAYTDEGPIKATIIASPLTYIRGESRHFTFAMHPMHLLHEMFHPGAGLEDHNGSGFWQNGNAGSREEVGMGNWGLMSHSKTDLITWEKWLLGFTLDTQIYCVEKVEEPKSYWLAPSGVKTTNAKLLVIKISKHKVLVVESARAAGVNHKLPLSAEGALVYVVDTSEERVEYGLTALRPAGTEINAQPFVLSEASLQLGESIDFEGYRIEVTEAGPFGDVVTVSKN